MALAGATGGELRIRDTIPSDLRMIRLVFERLGLRSRARRQRRHRPRRPEPRDGARRRRAQDHRPGRPVARVPGRPHVDRGRARDPVLRHGADPRVDVREPHDLHRQARPDGRGHHALRPAPGARLGPVAAARRAPRVAGHPRRDGDAHRRAVRRGDARRSATSARSTAATSASTSACASSAPASSASRPSRSVTRTASRRTAGAPSLHRLTATRERPTTIHPIPSGTRDVLPDEMRELRDITEAIRGIFELDGYGEVWTPRSSTRTCSARGGGAPPAYRVVRRPRRGARAAHGHDRADRAARRDALSDRRAAAALLLLRPRLPRRAPAPRPDARVPAGGDRARRRARAARHRGGADGALPRARRPPACAATGSASATPRCTARCCARFDVRTRGRRPARRRARRGATSSRSRPSSRELGLGDDDAELLLRVPQLRGGPEVLDEADGPVADAVAGLRRRLRAARPARSPSA